MNNDRYVDLIKSIPVEDQTCYPSKERWIKLLQESQKSEYIDTTQWELGYSRKDLFDLKLNEEKLIRILMWGYETGGRGKHIYELLRNQLANIVSILREYDENSFDDITIKQLISRLDRIQNLGPSTWSKFLYFCNIKLGNIPLLILDNKVAKAIDCRELYGANFGKYSLGFSIDDYLDYCIKVDAISKQLLVNNDKIELFFFLFVRMLRI